MEKFFNWISLCIGTVGGTIAGIMGGGDALLVALAALVALDYLTGLIKGIYLKQLSSEIGFKGLLKKIMIFIVIAAAHTIQQIVGNAIPLREVVIMFFIANEGLSLIENAAVFIPIPAALKETLIQLREKEGDDTVDKGH